MPDPQDQVEIEGVVNPASVRVLQPEPANKKWLGVWFTCCHTYGRMTRDEAGQRYVGFCPKCRAKVNATVGEGGTSRRFFKTE